MRDKNRSIEFEDELDRPVRKRRHSILQRVVLVTIVLLLVCIGIGGWKIYKGFQPVSSESETVSFTVPEGATIKSVSEDLAEQGIIDSSQIGYYYAKLEGFSNLIAGTFTLDKSWDLNKIYTTLTDINASTNQSGISVTIIDGDWAKHIAENISSVTNVSYDELIALWNNQEYLRSLMPKYPFLTEEMFQEGVRCYLEGYFAPNTYQFDEDSTAQEITEKILDQTLVVYNQYADQFAASTLSTHQIFTLASIVQYEGTGDMEVLKNIASVFYNRLNTGMTLGSSVTVCYAIDFDRDNDNWQACEVNTDFDSPYNTYLHQGLPPGAVANAGPNALEAVLNPNQTNYYYFMADVYGDGTVYFSETLDQHNALVAQYLG